MLVDAVATFVRYKSGLDIAKRIHKCIYTHRDDYVIFLICISSKQFLEDFYLYFLGSSFFVVGYKLVIHTIKLCNITERTESTRFLY